MGRKPIACGFRSWDVMNPFRHQLSSHASLLAFLLLALPMFGQDRPVDVALSIDKDASGRIVLSWPESPASRRYVLETSRDLGSSTDGGGWLLADDPGFFGGNYSLGVVPDVPRRFFLFL